MLRFTAYETDVPILNDNGLVVMTPAIVFHGAGLPFGTAKSVVQRPDLELRPPQIVIDAMNEHQKHLDQCRFGNCSYRDEYTKNVLGHCSDDGRCVVWASRDLSNILNVISITHR